MLANQKRTEFSSLAMPHTDSLYGAAMRLTRGQRDAEDLVQETLLRAYRFWETFDRTSNCRAWLLKILTNTFINEYQRKKRSREILDAATAEQEATDGVLVQESAQRFASPEQMLIDRGVSDDVQRALDQLPDDFRLAVVLCDMQGLSYKEIADMMECPVGTVMSRLFRGRKMLAASLAGYAQAQGITNDKAPVDLDAYRKARAAKGGR